MKSMRMLAVAAAVLSTAVSVRCAGSCRPWLLNSSLNRGSVEVSLTFGKACTPENAGYHFMRYRTSDAAGRQEFAFQSSNYPEQQAALDAALKSMALLGATDQDIDVLDQTVMPLVASGQAAEAADVWRKHLSARVARSG